MKRRLTSQKFADCWDEQFKQALREKVREMKSIKQGKDFLDIAECCVEALGETGYRDLAQGHFDREFTYEDIPPAYQAHVSRAKTPSLEFWQRQVTFDICYTHNRSLVAWYGKRSIS
jgi:hypothetical protein